MPLTARRRPRLAALVVGVVASAGVAAGCASSGGGNGADPASLVPASAPLYVEAVVGGDGQEQRDAQAAVGKVLRTTDPQGEFVRLFDRAGRGRVQFVRDVEPWLGDRIGAAALTLGRRGGDKVVVAASRDNAKAQDALTRIVAGGTQRTYRDVDYRVGERGFAGAVVGDSVVLGTEDGLKAAIDASKSSSLAGSDAFKDARAKVRAERSGFLYLDVAGVLRQALGAAGGNLGQLAPLADSIAGALPKTVAAALDAEPGLLRVDSAAFGNGAASGPAASGADALAALPADAWLGVGVGELGQRANGVLDRVASGGGIAGVGVQALLGQAQQTLGLDIRRDLLAWMGDAGIYAAGTTADDMRAALVIASKDPAATQRAVRSLAALVGRGADVSPLRAAGVDEGFVVRRGGGAPDVLVAAAGNRFVIAFGRQALDEALSPGAGLGTAPAFRDAAAKLSSDVRPSFFVDVQKLSARADAKGGAHGRELREHLGAFGAVIGGSRRDGDTTRGEAVATLP